MPVYLVRHAHAGARSAWHDDDELRPLSQKGSRQADAVRARLEGASIGCVVSSPSRRCIETVEPVAKELGVDVDTRREFFEGSDPDEALALLLDLAPRDPVVCSHGDLIPKMIRRLVAMGMKTKDANISQKGSLWVIDVEKGNPVKGRYHPPG